MPESARPGLPPDKVMVMCAPNGARRQKADHPAIPLTPGELAEEATRLLAAGVSVLHLHVRAPDGTHTLDVDTYRRAIHAIRDAVGRELAIQVTTEALGRYGPAEQTDMVRRLRPEAVSLALRELCPTPAEEPGATRFFRWLDEAGIWAQHIVYGPAELARLVRLDETGRLGPGRHSCLFVLGSYSRRRAGSAGELEAFLAALDPGRWDWTACCFGRSEHALLLRAAALGGQVRLGFENNLELPNGDRATGNAALIEHFRSALDEHGRQAASAAEVRAAFYP